MSAQAFQLRRRSPRAFTLVELVVAMGIMTMLLLAVQSTIVLASRSIPDSRSKATSLISASSALETLNNDLTFATAITSRSATAITIQVPDRNGDGNPETITWSWSGTKGTPLTRTMNGGAAVSFAANVQSFALSYDVRSVQAPPTYTASSEQLFLSVPSALLTNSTVTIKNTKWLGQYFKPNLPSSATSWAVTRVQINVRNHSSAQGTTAVQVRTVGSGNLPTTRVVDQVIMQESALDSNYLWTQFSFANATGLDPNAGCAIVFQWLSDTESCDIQTQSLTGLLAAGNMLTSGGNDTNWSSNTLNSINCYIYGTYSTQDPVATLYYLTGARATLLTSADKGATARTTVRMINELQVAAP